MHSQSIEKEALISEKRLSSYGAMEVKEADAEISVLEDNSEGLEENAEDGFTFVSSDSGKISWAQKTIQAVLNIPLKVVKGMVVPVAYLPIADVASPVAAFNVIINEEIAGPSAKTLLAHRPKYIPAFFDHVGDGNKKIGVSKIAIRLGAAVALTAGMIYAITSAHNEVLDGDFLSDDQFAGAVITASIQNPYARDAVLNTIALLGFKGFYFIIEKLTECCRSKSGYFDESKYPPSWLQQKLVWPFKLFFAFSTTEAIRVVFKAYDQTALANHFMLPLSVYAISDKFMSGWEHLATHPAPFESLVERKKEDSDKQLNIQDIEKNEVNKNAVTNCQKFGATVSALTVTKVSIVLTAGAVYGISAINSYLHPNDNDKEPSFAQRLGEATLVFGIGNFLFEGLKFGAKQVANCRLFQPSVAKQDFPDANVSKLLLLTH